MLDALCDERHVRIDDELKNHDKRIAHLEANAVRTEVTVQNLCQQISSLVSSIKWLIGVSLTGAVGFVVWYIQNIGG